MSEVFDTDYDVHFPDVGDWRDYDDPNEDVEDEELLETPEDVIAILGFDPKEFSGSELELYNPRQPRDKGGKWTKGGGGPSDEASLPSSTLVSMGVSPANIKKMQGLAAHAGTKELLVPLSMKPDQRKALQKANPGLTVKAVNAKKLLGSTPKAAPKGGKSIGSISNLDSPFEIGRIQALTDAGFSGANAKKIGLINGPITHKTAKILVPHSIKPNELKALQSQYPGKTIQKVNANKIINSDPDLKGFKSSPKAPPKAPKAQKSGFGKKSKPYSPGYKPPTKKQEKAVEKAGQTILQKTGNKREAAILIDEDGNVHGPAITMGNKSSVNTGLIPGKMDPPPRLTVVHNHPNNTSFSSSDIANTVFYKGQKDVVAVGSDGSFYRGTAGPKTRANWNSVRKAHKQGIKRVNELHQKASWELGSDAPAKWSNGPGLWSVTIALVNEKLAKDGYIDNYVAKHGSSYNSVASKYPKYMAHMRKAMGLE